MLDLGSIGKGFAIDLAAEILKDAGVQDWFIQGGTSTIYATGTDAEKQPWRVCVTAPQLEIHQEAAEPIAAPSLDGRALSVSAVSGKYFRHDGQVFGHVIDPRTGWPGTNAAMAAVLYPNAAESDALSTAVLLAKPEELDALAIKLPLPFGFLQAPFPGKASIIQHNFPVLAPGNNLGRVIAGDSQHHI